MYKFSHKKQHIFNNFSFCLEYYITKTNQFLYIIKVILKNKLRPWTISNNCLFKYLHRDKSNLQTKIFFLRLEYTIWVKLCLKDRCFQFDILMQSNTSKYGTNIKMQKVLFASIGMEFGGTIGFYVQFSKILYDA